jgi:competence protein ComEC
MIIGLGQFLMPATLPVWKRLLWIQLLFSLLFIPISVLVFGQVHSASLVANLVAVPLVSFIVVPLNFLLLVLFWLPADWISLGYQALDMLLGWLLYFLNLLSQVGLNAFPVADITPMALLVIAVCLVLLLVPRALRPASAALLVLPISLIVYSKTITTSVADGEYKVAALDVGTGSSIVVQTRAHTLVYDFGPGNDKGFSTAEWVLEPFLRSQGINHLQGMVISHTDQDHSGGFHAIKGRWTPELAYAGMPMETKRLFSKQIPFMDCHHTGAWWWDGVHFEFFPVEREIMKSDNNRSCVLKVSNQLGSVLIPGDIESSAEFNLIQQYGARLKSDVLIAPHHGSNSSSSEAFIQQVQPRYVVFQTGYLNRWRFPRPEVLKRYHSEGVESLQTSNDGAILIDCGHVDCKVESYRQLHPRPWY